MIFSGFGPINVHLKIPIGFLFTFWPISKQTADVQKKVEGIEWPAINATYATYDNTAIGQNVFCKQTADIYLMALGKIE